MPNFNKRKADMAFQSTSLPPPMIDNSGRHSFISVDSISDEVYNRGRYQNCAVRVDCDNISCGSGTSIGSFHMTLEEMNEVDNYDVQIMFVEFSEGKRRLPLAPPSISLCDHDGNQMMDTLDMPKQVVFDMVDQLESRDDEDAALEVDDDDEDGSLSVSSVKSFRTLMFQQQDGEMLQMYNAFQNEMIDGHDLGKDEPMPLSVLLQTQTIDCFDTPSPPSIRNTLVPIVTFENSSPMQHASRCDHLVNANNLFEPNILTPSPSQSPWQKQVHQNVRFPKSHILPGLDFPGNSSAGIVRRIEQVSTATKAWENVHDQMLVMALDSFKQKDGQDSDSYWDEIARRFFAGTRTASECKLRWKMHSKMSIDFTKTSMSAKDKKNSLGKPHQGRKGGEKGTKTTRKRRDVIDLVEIPLSVKPWTDEEDKLIVDNLDLLGNKWIILARLLPNRSIEDIKIRFDQHERGRQIDENLFANDDWMDY